MDQNGGISHRLGMTIDDELLNRLDAVAGSLELSRAEVMRRVLRAGLDDLQNKGNSSSSH